MQFVNSSEIKKTNYLARFSRSYLGEIHEWKDWPAVSKFLPMLEEALQPFAPHSHLGQLFAIVSSTIAGYFSADTGI